MGCDYRASIIIGIEADEAINYEIDIEKVKRFNELTGESYIKEEKNTYKTLFGKRVENIEESVNELGLDYININEDEYIGIEFSNSGSNRSGLCINFERFDKLSDIYHEVKNKLSKVNYNGDVYIINALDVSC